MLSKNKGTVTVVQLSREALLGAFSHLEKQDRNESRRSVGSAVPVSWHRWRWPPRVRVESLRGGLGCLTPQTLPLEALTQLWHPCVSPCVWWVQKLISSLLMIFITESDSCQSPRSETVGSCVVFIWHCDQNTAVGQTSSFPLCKQKLDDKSERFLV